MLGPNLISMNSGSNPAQLSMVMEPHWIFTVKTDGYVLSDIPLSVLKILDILLVFNHCKFTYLNEERKEVLPFHELIRDVGLCEVGNMAILFYNQYNM